MKARIYLLISTIIISISTYAQTSMIKGKVVDKASHAEVPFASIVLYKDTMIIATTYSDIDGIYMFKSIAPGHYTVKVTCVGYQPITINNVTLNVGQIAFVDIEFEKGLSLDAVNVTGYSIHNGDRKKTSKSHVVINEEIQAAPTRNINSIAVRSAGVYQNDNDNGLNVRGSRNDGTAYYIDGVKVEQGSVNATVKNDESYDRIIENKYFDALHNPLSTFSIDVDAASYSNIRRLISDGELPPKDAVRIEEMINYFRYDYPQPEEGVPFSITTENSQCPWNSKHSLIRIGLKGRDVKVENLPDNNLVFLIDVSGSMEASNKLPLLKKSFHLLVEQLRSQDRVSIVVYAGNAGLVLPSTKGIERREILAAIDNLEAGGSTAGGAGIQLAYKIAKDNFIKNGNNRVILATDGDFNVGISDDNELTEMIEGKRDEGIFLTVLGFGVGNYKDSKMEKLADKGNGNFAYVDNIMEAKKVFVNEMGATLNTIAKDVKLQIEFNPSKVKAYRLLGYENRVLEDRDFNDDKKDAGELGSGHSVTALYEIIPANSDEIVDSIDSLRYQKKAIESSDESNELMTVKLRYKDPKENNSKLIVHPLVDVQDSSVKSSNDFRFACAVVEFGMILRNSKYIGNANFESILSLARESKGSDNEGYRAEFIRLVENAELLFKETAELHKKK